MGIFKVWTKIAIDQKVFEKSDLRVKVYVMIMKKYKKQLLFVSNKKPNKTIDFCFNKSYIFLWIEIVPFFKTN